MKWTRFVDHGDRWKGDFPRFVGKSNLTHLTLDPIAKIPEYKVTAVRIIESLSIDDFSVIAGSADASTAPPSDVTPAHSEKSP